MFTSCTKNILDNLKDNIYDLSNESCGIKIVNSMKNMEIKLDSKKKKSDCCNI